VSPASMRFFIELPADTKLEAASQIWARVLPNRGSKLLTHANVDLTQAGAFSSQPGAVLPALTATAMQASYTEVAAPSPSDVPPVISEGKWVTAEPGKPANLPADAQDVTGGGWKKSSEPIPMAVARSVEVTPIFPAAMPRSEPISEQTAERERPAKRESSAKRPGWAADRPGNSARRLATRPSWSDTR
jgi:hypothetical protein